MALSRQILAPRVPRHEGLDAWVSPLPRPAVIQTLCAGLCLPHLLALCRRPHPPAVKEVRNSAFVSTLKEHMQQLRHSKLYKAHKKEVVRVRGVNRNPMKVSAAARV